MTENESLTTTLQNAIDCATDDITREDLEMMVKCLEELQQYRAIGTIDEFKALKEKNEPKKLLTKWDMYPTNHGIYSASDRWCPNCKALVFDGDWDNCRQRIMYGKYRCGCGQKLDWSE